MFCLIPRLLTYFHFSGPCHPKYWMRGFLGSSRTLKMSKLGLLAYVQILLRASLTAQMSTIHWVPFLSMMTMGMAVKLACLKVRHHQCDAMCIISPHLQPHPPPPKQDCFRTSLHPFCPFTHIPSTRNSAPSIP
ncbi:hypothetical protein BDZ94DRAFT_1264661 [Collybia nuda]|uniref:Uncharacterized protein n=1 Tax=Collybia nuda TaxID=64659 RepID=A0A9P6CG93_9AGAR|nr:hypothetical protein BDZ94DRAFT_1264661 [Collybia nuda]